MKKVVKDSGFGGGFKPVLSRKKRKDVALEEGIGSKEMPTEVPSDHFWGFKTGNTTKSESINMEEECLVEETSFDYGEKDILIDGDYKHTPKGPSVKTTKALGKPLDKINFSGHDNDDNVFLNTPLELLSLLKNLVSVSVRKSFALDIGLNKVVGKSSQEKLMVIRKLFLRINGFGGVFTPSKFFGIIWAIFTSELDLMKATKKTANVKIMVNIDLIKSTGHSDRAVVMKEILVETSAKTVCTALFEFGEQSQADLLANRWSILIGKDAVYVVRSDLDKVTWDKRDLYRTLLYTLPVKTNAHDIWDFISSVDKKTCIINHYLVLPEVFGLFLNVVNVCLL
ncbi:hypothetical protein G9A89_021416 [Geosiphon pyriformis]|nr:hypothetical protein G9A89_021416 [Geosiphon pyriformis]